MPHQGYDCVMSVLTKRIRTASFCVHLRAVESQDAASSPAWPSGAPFGGRNGALAGFARRGHGSGRCHGGAAAPIPASEAEIPDAVVNAFPAAMNCRSLNVAPVAL